MPTTCEYLMCAKLSTRWRLRVSPRSEKLPPWARPNSCPRDEQHKALDAESPRGVGIQQLIISIQNQTTYVRLSCPWVAALCTLLSIKAVQNSSCTPIQRRLVARAKSCLFPSLYICVDSLQFLSMCLCRTAEKDLSSLTSMYSIYAHSSRLYEIPVVAVVTNIAQIRKGTLRSLC